MLFESTKTLLRGIVHALENSDEGAWDGHLESCNQCLYELHQMSRSSNRTYKIDGANPKFPSILPATERAVRTIPHVKSMMSAIRRRDQDVALRAGMVAVREMDGIAAPPPAPAISQPAVSTEKSAPQPVARAVKHPRKRAPQAKRKPARTVATSSR